MIRHSLFTKTLCSLLLAALSTVGAVSHVHALFMDGTIDERRSDGYSVVQFGDDPDGEGNMNDWLWFNAGQGLQFDLTGGVVSLDGNQSFNLSSNNGASSVIQFSTLDLNLNDFSDGFLGGSLEYVLDDSTTGTFLFLNDNYNALLNSSSFDGTNIEIYAFGSDSQSNLSIVLGISAVVGIQPPLNTVPSSGSLALLAIGVFSLVLSRRKSQPEVQSG